jgi:CDP-diacylglycerol--glycerol-3-phosphate 3-phosphatidyltransferase
MRWNVPILLTWLRMLAIPLLVAVYLLPPESASMPMRNLAGTVVFVAAAVTDWVDGWLARRLGQTTAFGAFLDPVADKLLVCAALVLLLELQRVDALVAVIIIGREIAISALREWMAGTGERASVAVHSIGKLKTVAQLVAIPMLLYHQPLFGVLPVQRIGTVLIWVAALLTLWSMFYYLRRAQPSAASPRDGVPGGEG